MKYALQLYTVRDACTNAEEFKKVLKNVKEIGYEGVEFAGFHGIPANELAEYLKEIDLVPLSTHHGIDELEQKKEEILSVAKTIGCSYVVCAYSPTSNEEETKRAVRVLTETKEAATKYGITIGYHNHSHEFRPLGDGSLPINMIRSSCGLEVDTYWVYHAKQDPAAYLLEHSEDIVLVHLKDGDENGHPCALGEGKNDVCGILEASEKIGAEWIIVENDNPEPDGLSDIKRSMEFLKKAAK